MVQKLLFRGLVAGLIAGLVAAVLQMTFVVPVLMEAELYETGALTHFGGASDAGAAHDHDHGAESDVQRTLMTWLAVTATFMGWGLIMAAAMEFARRADHIATMKTGLVWGLAGFLAVHLAPAVGLPPELPGNAAADLSTRQLWWVLAVLVSAIGLAVIAFGRGVIALIGGLLILLVPHLIGAPHPNTWTGPAPPELAGEFAARALATNAFAWAILGAALGALIDRERT